MGLLEEDAYVDGHFGNFKAEGDGAEFFWVLGCLGRRGAGGGTIFGGVLLFGNSDDAGVACRTAGSGRCLVGLLGRRGRGLLGMSERADCQSGHGDKEHGVGDVV